MISFFSSDLAIGAYGSDNAFVFFTNPPITMTVETKTNLTLPPGQTKATIIPQNTTAFTLNVCFDYEGENIPSDVGKRNNVAYVVLWNHHCSRRINLKIFWAQSY